MRELARLGPIEQLRAGRSTRRLVQLAVGLALYGVTLGLMIRATLGNAPWDVLHQGMALHLPISIGVAGFLIRAFVLLFWIPLRVLPALGTLPDTFGVRFAAGLPLSALDVPRGRPEGVVRML